MNCDFWLKSISSLPAIARCIAKPSAGCRSPAFFVRHSCLMLIRPLPHWDFMRKDLPCVWSAYVASIICLSTQCNRLSMILPTRLGLFNPRLSVHNANHRPMRSHRLLCQHLTLTSVSLTAKCDTCEIISFRG